MIASLTGRLKQKNLSEIIIDVGGVGYRVFVSKETFSQLPLAGQEVSLPIYTHVREDEISLYGFAKELEKVFFQKLISVSGIGPKLALTILSGISTQDLTSALHSEDLVRLTSIPGIGKKTAERMIVELKDKLTEIGGALLATERKKDGKRQMYDDILSALMNLGYNRFHAEQAVSRITLAEGISLQQNVKAALKLLSEKHL
ncbi:MAG: Holliday junction branch migration protein RuvA [Deltaproteobacteria bacterium]|nr:Holliday junction branch migration protein RuvA [Deltaproteobacteria bacterium]